MPQEYTKRSVLLTSLWSLIVTVLVGAGTSVSFAVFHWDKFVAFSNRWGNVALRRGADDLNGIARFVERNRVAPGSTRTPLRAPQIKLFEALLTLVTNISARMRRQVLEVPHANV